MTDFMSKRHPATRLEINDRLESLGYDDNDHGSAIERFQEFNGLKVDGSVGEVTERLLLWTPRCGCPDIQRAGMCLWPMKDVSYWHNLQFTTISQADVNQAWDDAVQSWSDVCGIRLFATDEFDAANIYAHPKRIDGRSGTVAWSFLPCGARRSTRLEQRYDTDENWSRLFLQATIAHEIGHALGLDHDSADTLMGPYGSSITLPTAKDVAQVVKRYGKPVPKPDPTPDPTPDPPSGEIVVTGNIKINGKPYSLTPTYGSMF